MFLLSLYESRDEWWLIQPRNKSTISLHRCNDTAFCTKEISVLFSKCARSDFECYPVSRSVGCDELF